MRRSWQVTRYPDYVTDGRPQVLNEWYHSRELSVTVFEKKIEGFSHHNLSRRTYSSQELGGG